MKKKMLPIGFNSFEDVVRNGCYYVDKTGFIYDFINNHGFVNLITRPECFGKTLNMSMLKCFFDINTDKTLFNGLKITEEKDFCDKYMGKLPVIFLSLKDVYGKDYEETAAKLSNVIEKEAARFEFLRTSDKLTDIDKKRYEALINFGGGKLRMKDIVICTALSTLSELLAKHYGCKTVILIDDYDVPLYKALQYGFYDDMAQTIQDIFNSALKSNGYLEFAAITGCLNISTESTYSDLNNFKVDSVVDVRFDKYFGFTEKDIQKLLKYYDLFEFKDVIREWYSGYLFGETETYCPYDVLNYCEALLSNRKTSPRNYRANTGSDELVKHVINKSKRRIKNDIKELLSGGTITKKTELVMTYSEINNLPGNIWSLLLSTGYITQSVWQPDNIMKLKIPNREIIVLLEKLIDEKNI